MPQVDLSSVCVKQVSADEPEPQLDYAPESFWLSQDAELDWLDRNAFIERKDSGKASLSLSNSNPPHPSTGSNRFSGSLKSKPSIIGLPKAAKPNYAEAKNRRHCKVSTIRLIPKRSESVGNKSEPSSPKVSCMGRVRSRRGKNRALVRNKSIQDRKPGFWKNFRAMFRHKSQKPEAKGVEPKKRGFNSNAPGECSGGAEPPGLGGVKRFASGRRSDGWAAGVELNKAPICLRRQDVEVGDDCHSVGPASV